MIAVESRRAAEWVCWVFGEGERPGWKRWYGVGAAFVVALQAAIVGVLALNVFWFGRATLASAFGPAVDDFGAADASPPVLMLPAPCGLRDLPGLFAALALHELGHAHAAVREGLKVERVGLFLAVCVPGAFVVIEDALYALPSAAQVRVFAAGPLANLVVAAAAAAAGALLPAGALAGFVRINLSLGLLNAAPLRFADGEAIFSRLLRRVLPRAHVKVTRVVSGATAALLLCNVVLSVAFVLLR